MPRLFIGNFDFEHRLASGATSLPLKLEAINTALAPAWIAVADDHDAIWSSNHLSEADRASLAQYGLPRVDFVANPRHLATDFEPVFWGEDLWAQSQAKALDRAWTGCDPAIVLRVNSRRWKLQLEQKLCVAPPGLALALSLNDLEIAIHNLPDDNWVLKTEFGGAGREIRFGRGHLSTSDQNWAASRFRRGLAVLVEPRLDSVAEAGLQFQIERDGEVSFLGVTPLLTRLNGSFLGSRYENDRTLLSIWHEAITIGQQAARLTAGEGYFGPLGIDAMCYRDSDGTIRIRPLQDLNARYTMGRLALGLRRFPEYAAASNYTFSPFQFCAPHQTLPAQRTSAE